MERKSIPKYNDLDYLLKIVLIGDAAVGKSSLLLRYIDDIYEDNYTCTIGVDFKIKTIDIDDKRVKLQIWDTAGQERFRPITSCYFRGAHGCLVIYDITNRESFMHVKTWIHDFREQNKVENEKNVILIGNKKDAEELRTVSFEEGQELAQAIGANFLEASAKSGFQVTEMFVTLAKHILSKSKLESVTRRDITRPNLKGASIDISSSTEKPKKKSSCC
jgi:Ras-related protein Rab-1A